MEFKKLMDEINFQREILENFKKIKPKRENIKKIISKLKQYKKMLDKKRNEKKVNNFYKKEITNVEKVLTFLNEMQFYEKTIVENNFILDWQEINMQDNTSFSPEEILETAPLLQKYFNYKEPQISIFKKIFKFMSKTIKKITFGLIDFEKFTNKKEHKNFENNFLGQSKYDSETRSINNPEPTINKNSSFEQNVKVDINQSMDLQSKPSTSGGYKPNSPQM